MCAQEITPEQLTIHRMNTAVKLNRLMRERSMNADLVMVNCPSVPTDPEGQANYVGFLDVS